MITPGFVLNILAAVSGIFLLVTAADDTLASIPGTVFAILGPAQAGFYYAMLTGW